MPKLQPRVVISVDFSWRDAPLFTELRLRISNNQH